MLPDLIWQLGICHIASEEGNIFWNKQPVHPYLRLMVMEDQKRRTGWIWIYKDTYPNDMQSKNIQFFTAVELPRLSTHFGNSKIHCF